MREILFKAKRIDNGEWVEGYLLRDGCTGQYFIHASGNSVNESDKVNEEGFLRFVAFEVDESTICQYTGLTDKNGRKIFEGDIVTTKYELGRGGFYTFEVYYNENLCQFALTINRGSYTKNKQYDWLQLTASKAKKIEVIGNVFDNPELLEKAR